MVQNNVQSTRHDGIVEAVIDAGSMRIDELAALFDVSRMTVHRDLDALEARGVLRKSRGVVTAVASNLFEASAEYRTRQNRSEKAAIASAALAQITPGEAVILDDSTTGLLLARQLESKQPLTVISNFSRVLDELEGMPGINLISTGGEYYQLCEAYRGSITLNTLGGLSADTYFMSTSAIRDGVCFHPHQDIVLVKQAMFRAAQRRILIMDHSKFRRTALHAMIPVADFDLIIVDTGISADDLDSLQRTGVEVLTAPIEHARHPKDPGEPSRVLRSDRRSSLGRRQSGVDAVD